ncbi:MAG: protease SohB [Gammaproteobacteria bacterium]
MPEALLDYGLFLAKTATVVVAIAVVLGLVVSVSRKNREPEGLQAKNLGKQLRGAANSLRQAMMPRKQWRSFARAQKKQLKDREHVQRPTLFVLDFKGDLRASASASLRREISAVLEVARPDDEVLVRLENYGGLVHEHGLAASQLARLRDRGIRLTAAVDKVAASGGYLMACVADRIIAAPFAIVGSIGVLAQVPNFRKLLEDRGVHVEQVKAGRYKRTVSMFGEVTDEDRDKLRQELEDVHALFQDMVARYRPRLDMGKVATGEYWHGTRALELGLVDDLCTSDEYLLRASERFDAYAVKWAGRKKITEKISAAMETGAARATEAALERARRGGLGC